jgi:hypothetical protein
MPPLQGQTSIFLFLVLVTLSGEVAHAVVFVTFEIDVVVIVNLTVGFGLGR